MSTKKSAMQNTTSFDEPRLNGKNEKCDSIILDDDDVKTVCDDNSDDKLFDPSIDMLVNDFDDERTLEEEEALEAKESHDAHEELNDLEKEKDMPLDELLALYGYNNVQKESSSDNSDDNQSVAHNGDEADEADCSSQDGFDITATDGDSSELRTNGDSGMPMKSTLSKFYNRFLNDAIDGDSDSSRILRYPRVNEFDGDEEDDDYDYSPDEDEWKKTIMVGADYQASIPDGLCFYDDALPYENEDKLLWDPTLLTSIEVDRYLQEISNKTTNVQNIIPGLTAKPMSLNQLRDDEQALFLLQQCGHNIDEALRRRRISAITSSDTISLWSEEECRNFESGLRMYGKDFHQIQQHKVRTRAVSELVQFYYLWKKTERHDMFASKSRLEKKKYSLHPGTTDFMERFLDEDDTIPTANQTTPLGKTLLNGGGDKSNVPKVDAEMSES